MRVLIVDDEPALVSFLVPLFERDGYQVEAVGGGAAALAAVSARAPDVVVLDVRLPDLSGLEVCRRLRRRPGRYLPVVLLTGSAGAADELAGFAATADDYVTKPFRPDALLARVRAVLRTAAAGAARQVSLGPVVVDLALREARRAGRVLRLKPREFELLAFLVEHPGQVFGRTQLLHHVWGLGHRADPHTVTSHMSRLRLVVEEDPTRPRYLCTRTGVGYYLRLPEPEPAPVAESAS